VRRLARSKAAWLVAAVGTLLSLALLWLDPAPPTRARAPAPPAAEPRPAAEAPTARPPLPPAAPGYRRLVLRGGVQAVHDGDTFSADLNGDGQLELPRERVRLLFVDTPELHESWKGQDVAHGEPARDFLAARLRRTPLVLHVPADRPTGRYGRTLARVEAGGDDLSLALIRAGHSPFDARFSFPPDYAAFVAAEGEAFQARRGIWADAPSRERYLGRLQREHRTPAAADNPRYVPGVQDAARLRPASYLGRYVVVEGTLRTLETLRRDVRRLRVGGGPGAPALTVVAFPATAERLGLPDWPLGARVRVEGFIQAYQGGLEMRLHWGERLP
jgi:endonuclease YncB( thermonuclease family)